MRYEFAVDLKPVKGRPEKKSNAPELVVPPVLRTLVLAYQIRDFMRAHGITKLSEFSARAHITKARATQILRLLNLSPRIQELILIGTYEQQSWVESIAMQKIFDEAVWKRQEQLISPHMNSF